MPTEPAQTEPDFRTIAGDNAEVRRLAMMVLDGDYRQAMRVPALGRTLAAACIRLLDESEARP